MSQAVIGIVPSFAAADLLVRDLTASGFANSEISILAPDSPASQLAMEKHSKAPEGTATGAAAGGLVGGTLGLLAGVGAIAIPGVGPFIAAGPIMAALSGAAVGSAVGGVSGGLIGLGIPEYEAKQYEGQLADGNILVSVHAEDKELVDRAKEIFKTADAQAINCVTEDKHGEKHGDCGHC